MIIWLLSIETRLCDSLGAGATHEHSDIIRDSILINRLQAAAEDAARHIFAVARQYDTSVVVWAPGETIEIDLFTERRIQPAMIVEDNTELSGDSHKSGRCFLLQSLPPGPA